MFKLFSSSSYDGPKVFGNPDPTNFVIKAAEEIGNFVIVLVYYPDSKNYEGRKILVYHNVSLTELKKQKSLDPHFSPSTEYHSPIARFEPTAQGITWAVAFCISQAASQ